MDNVFEIKVNYRDFSKVELRDVISAAKDVLKTGMFEIERTSKTKYLSGPRPVKLGVVSNALRASVKGTVEQNGYNLLGHAGIGPHVWYGKVHEEGLGGMKKRPFLVPAIEDHIQDITDKILKSIDDTLEGQI